MDKRRRHEREVEEFLREHLGSRDWALTLPHGSGNETYVARSGEESYFVKVGAFTERAAAMAQAGLSPPVVASGQLGSGATIMVQPFVDARQPTPRDLQEHIEQIAHMVGEMHHDPGVMGILPRPQTDMFRDGALGAVAYVREQWPHYRHLLGEQAREVESALLDLEAAAAKLQGLGLVPTHGDFCTPNLLITPDGKLYIIDLELMALDDPARDLGPALWWYYPPEMRRRFIETAGYEDTPELRHRMRVRMSLHCLCAALPRPNSFDTLDPSPSNERLADFWAVYTGKENPQGY